VPDETILWCRIKRFWGAECGDNTYSAPYDALLQVIEGKGIVFIEDKKFELLAPFTIIMPANKPHSVQATQRFKMVLVMIKAQ